MVTFVAFNMKLILVVVVCSSFLGWVSGGHLARRHSTRFLQPRQAPGPGNDLWFEQKLDHNDPTNRAMWKQRYMVNEMWVRNINNMPVFLMISGEAPMERRGGAWMDYARRYGALCFQLEHRFYGYSQPTGDLSVSSLRYLSSEQALADIAAFIDGMNRMRGLTGQWVVFGGSYAGSLAAWARLKYPSLIQAAVSSSGPVLAQLDFKGYNEVVWESLAAASPECAENVHLAALQVADASTDPYKFREISQKFPLCQELNFENPNDVSLFLQLLADPFDETAQYDDEYQGSVDKICSIMTNPSHGDIIDRYAAVHVNRFYVPVTCPTFNDYISELQNESVTNRGRAWLYQTCTEFGFFQTSSSRSELFGPSVNVQFYIDQCTATFGSSFDLSRVIAGIDKTNSYYGQLDIVNQVTNVIFVQGSLDPWHVLGVNNSTNPESPAIVIEGASHCANMYTPQQNPPDLPQMVEARRNIESFLDRILLT